ncbi:trehalose operon repressor [Macrococcoides caseolyticum]|uniref:Trehalose operon repressor n=1 Tax=Macrococcus caseolyticus (strain JCSC5402) TaxID=458233 RepID=B9E8X5_MACCJ|nr:trehalose operon repressor [Macrococcus caseolyticus]BAH18643.1 GntR family regulatory protein homolog [Macrococcus caseolyticus JCSC5402]
MNNNKYRKIYQDLSGKIINGEYKEGVQLPSENLLVKSYGVSRETVRKALSLLQTNGYIQKLKGKGSIVIYNQAMNFPVSQLISFEEIKHSLNMDYNTVVESFETVRAADHKSVQEALNLGDDTELYRVVRSRREKDRVNIIDTDYFIKSMMPGLDEEIARQSIYDYIEKRLGLRISYSNKAITFEPMTEDDLELFKETMPPYAAVVRSVVHLEDASVFQYNISKHRASEFKFVDFSRRTIRK